ncbi:diaminobutyrate--2-oxoglutarate transaminase family protein [Streptomyces luteocolor]|uniref:diaminobutyrate--2-oxoglutarate transaminase family protein n=1 Tax=Streptomyces luteocolor TaxID=285500 RepID=UPI003F76B3AB
MAVTEPASAAVSATHSVTNSEGSAEQPATHPTGDTAAQTGVQPGVRAGAQSLRNSTAHEGILRRQSARESAARTYARALPIVPVRARGLTIEGADGRRYLDCLSGAGTLALGHNHPVVLEAIRKVLDSGAPLHVLDLATPVKDAFTTELFRTLPRGLADRARIQFCGPAGTDAVEAALKLVRAATGRDGLLAFTGAYHGMTAGALEASGGAQDVRVARLPYPQDYRCPFGLGGARGAELSARWAESLLDDTKSGVPQPAGMILEPVQGEGGVLPAPDAWLRRMREITAARGIPLIADEVQTGVGRTGAFWAVEHSGVVPDVMVLSKAIGGSLPLAVVIYRDDLDVWPPGAHAGTFRGNQLAMAAGTATLAYVRENGLAERAATLGAHMLAQLRSLAAEHPCIGEVRGRGLMIGVELVDPSGGSTVTGGTSEVPGTGGGASADGGGRRADGSGLIPEGYGPAPEGGGGTPGGGGLTSYGGGLTPDDGAGLTIPSQTVPVRGGGADAAPSSSSLPGSLPGRSTSPTPSVEASDGLPFTAQPHPPAPELAAAVQRECLRRGLIVELGGRHSSVVRLLPPLTITDEQASAILDRLADALATAARAHHGQPNG